jgi:hypothetical protein
MLPPAPYPYRNQEMEMDRAYLRKPDGAIEKDALQ